MNTYLGLAAASTNGVNPDILGLHASALVEVHVLHELLPAQVSMFVSSKPGRRLKKA